MLSYHRSRSKSRRGAALAEAAIVLPILMILLLGMIMGAVGIYYYHQVATLAREGARYASVRNGDYEQDLNLSAITPEEVYEEAIQPRAVGLNMDSLTYSVSWQGGSDRSPVYLANASTNSWRRNHVTVTISYDWSPPIIFGPLTLRSTSVMPLTY